MTKNKHWYFYYYAKCPNCGLECFDYKERRYTLKPEECWYRESLTRQVCNPCSEVLTPIEIMEMGG